MTDLTQVELLLGHFDEGSALVVDDYPYGRRVRTQIRYWLETVAGKGDRFVSQTLNPKTGRWNNPKKSTYSDVGVMYREPDTGYVRWTGVRTSPEAAELQMFVEAVGLENFNREQKRMISMIIGRTKAFANVTFSIRTGEQTEEEKEAQQLTESQIWARAQVESIKAYREMN